MKRLIALVGLLSCVAFANPGFAQLEKGNLLVGGNLMNMDMALGSSSRFSLDLVPKLGYFIKDNVVIGGLLGVDYSTAKNQGNTFRYEVGTFGRYYLSPDQVEPLTNHGRFFAEANLGLGGDNNASFGLSYGVGPGYSYFITKNVGLEALLKLQGIAGTGASVGLGFGLGFQIYLPSGAVKSAYQ